MSWTSIAGRWLSLGRCPTWLAAGMDCGGQRWYEVIWGAHMYTSCTVNTASINVFITYVYAHTYIVYMRVGAWENGNSSIDLVYSHKIRFAQSLSLCVAAAAIVIVALFVLFSFLLLSKSQITTEQTIKKHLAYGQVNKKKINFIIFLCLLRKENSFRNYLPLLMNSCKSFLSGSSALYGSPTRLLTVKCAHLSLNTINFRLLTLWNASFLTLFWCCTQNWAQTNFLRPFCSNLLSIFL